MLFNLFNEMCVVKVLVLVCELFDLIDVLKYCVVFVDMDEFYYLVCIIMVKDECYFDKFDWVFGVYFKGLEKFDDYFKVLIFEEWLCKEFECLLIDEEKVQIQFFGGLDKLIEEFKKCFEEQKECYVGGNKWIGIGGISLFGFGGFNLEGICVGDVGKCQGKVVKVWDQCEYKNFDDQVELGMCNIKIVLWCLCKFVCEGVVEELDIDGIIDYIVKDVGLFNIQMCLEWCNMVKLLLLLDIGGLMDVYVKVCEELFLVCKIEFKYLEYFYFYNFIYELVWKNNLCCSSECIVIFDLLYKYGLDYKVVFVGDVVMVFYEIIQVGGSVEYWNEEVGYVWMQCFMEKYKKFIWINFYLKDIWNYMVFIGLVCELVKEQMYLLILSGLEEGMCFFLCG